MCFLELKEKSACLAKVCEANFERLLRLIPNFADLAECSVARADGKPSLYLQLLKHSPYTLTLELSHRFSKESDSLVEPDVKIRVYLDARAAEMLSDHARPRVHEALSQGRQAKEVLDYKWSLNYFLSQWLDHCLANEYRFGVVQPERKSFAEQA